MGIDLRRRIARGARVVEERFDSSRFRLKRRFGLLDPFEILPYRGYGTPRGLLLKGRVLEEAGVSHVGQDATLWLNLRNM
ncbi:MAG: App1 family protein, partial [Rubrobacter sp.]